MVCGSLLPAYVTETVSYRLDEAEARADAAQFVEYDASILNELHCDHDFEGHAGL